MIGIGPILVVMSVIAIVGAYVAVIHHALKSTEVSKSSEVRLTANKNSSQPEQSGDFVPVKA